MLIVPIFNVNSKNSASIVFVVVGVCDAITIDHQTSRSKEKTLIIHAYVSLVGIVFVV